MNLEKLNKRTTIKTVKYDITENQVEWFDNYQKGDVVVISSKDFSKLINKNNKRLKLDERVSKDDFYNHKKFTRPLLVVWNHELSNYMLVASLTTQCKHSKFKVKVTDTSYANTSVYVLNKNRIPILNDGEVIDYVEARKTDSWEIRLKQYNPEIYTLFLRLLSSYQSTVIKRLENLKKIEQND